MTKEEYVKENYSPTKCKVIVTDDKQHLAISLMATLTVLYLQIWQGGQNMAIA